MNHYQDYSYLALPIVIILLFHAFSMNEVDWIRIVELFIAVIILGRVCDSLKIEKMARSLRRENLV